MSESDEVDILLVEDNAHDAELTLRALRKAEVKSTVHWVKDGVEALDFVRATGPHANRAERRLPKLLLLDLKMPRVDGLEVVRELKADERTRAIPIVAFTSSKQRRDLDESYRLGVNGYVTKPVQFADYVDAIARIESYWLRANLVPHDV